MADIKYRAGYCVTCQKPYKDRYSHAKKYPSHVIQQHTAPKGTQPETLDASDALDDMSEAAETQAGAQAKKVSGADFASQPIFVAAVGVGLGSLTARVFGRDNALHKEEAYGIAAGMLRLIGRHFLKNIQMEELTQANNDVNDFLLIGRAVASYIGRLWQKSDQQQGQPQAARPQAAPAQPEPQPQAAPTPRQNGRGPSLEDEAAMIQAQMSASLAYMPYMGEAA